MFSNLKWLVLAGRLMFTATATADGRLATASISLRLGSSQAQDDANTFNAAIVSRFILFSSGAVLMNGPEACDQPNGDRHFD
jgi:hypothetical protein